MADRITKDEIQAIAEAFSDYEFDDQEKGLYYLCKSRQGRIDFVKGYVRLGIQSGWIRSYGDRNQSYMCIRTHRSGSSITGWIAFIQGIIKGMGIAGAIRFSKDYFRAGKPIEKKFEKSGYVQIKMLAVKKEYQGQGYMRKMVRSAFDLADELKVPCIVSTDAKSKADRYKHLGFELYQIRKLSDHSVEYDMVRCFGNNNQTVI